MPEKMNKLNVVGIKFVETSAELCGPKKKKSNSRKNMTSLFAYLILKASDMPLTQSDILDKLSKYPYDVNIERKALSRVIHGLEDTGLGIVSDKSGIRYDASLAWAA